MAIVSVPGLWFPKPYSLAGATPSYSSFNFNGSSLKKAFITPAPKTGAIRKVHLRLGVVTTPTDTDVRVETLDSSGNPSGTLWGTNTNGTLASGSISSNAWVTITLTADASVNKGDAVAVVVVPSGSPSYILQSALVAPSDSLSFPYGASFSGAWSKTAVGPMVFALEYSDGSFAFTPGSLPASTLNTHAISSSTTPDEIALKFSLPVSMRASGAWASAARPAGTDVTLVLYDSDGTTVLASVSLDGDFAVATTGRTLEAPFPATVTLQANVSYYLSYKPTTTTSATLYSFNVSAAALLDCLDGGQAFSYAEQTDAGGWTPTLTRRPLIGLLLDGIDSGGSPGGSPIIGSAIVRAA